MNFLEELKIRIKYRDEMKLWENELKEGITEKLSKAFLQGRIKLSEYDEISRVTFPDLENWQGTKLKSRVMRKR